MKLFKKIFATIECMRWAIYAANLARNGQIQRAQACYTDREAVNNSL